MLRVGTRAVVSTPGEAVPSHSLLSSFALPLRCSFGCQGVSNRCQLIFLALPLAPGAISNPLLFCPGLGSPAERAPRPPS